jgi:hypothetical protein
MRTSLWRKLFSWAHTARSPRTGSRRQRQPFRPRLEGLEDRLVPATGSISGHVLLDQTGNGLSKDDTGLGHVTVRLFRDTNHNGILDGRDQEVAARVSAADGSYSFANLSAGTYFVAERTPRGFVRTAPTTGSYYSVPLPDGGQVKGQDFDNFRKLHRGVVNNVSFTVTTPGGTSTTVSDLRGHTQQGDTVQANFTVARGAGPTVLTLVSYNAPGSTFNPATASQDTIAVVASGTFGPGRHSLSVTLPNSFYQVDFVLGPAINQFGPAGSNIFYTAEHRLLSQDNGGTPASAPSTISGTVFADLNGTGQPGGSNPTLSGVTVTLTGKTTQGQPVTRTATPDSVTGAYSFTGVQPGMYTISVNAVSTYQPETATVGLFGSQPGSGTAGAGVVSNILVTSGTQATGYNFGEAFVGGS